MKEISSISELPNLPSVYALYGQQGAKPYVAYVGMTGRLKNRITQHLVRRDSSVVTGGSAVALLPDHVIQVDWWEHADFDKRPILEVAELVAFDIFEPALRSRGTIQEQAKQLYQDEEFYQTMKTLFSNDPAGRLTLPTLQVAFDRIDELEKRVALLEQRLAEILSSDS